MSDTEKTMIGTLIIWLIIAAIITFIVLWIAKPRYVRKPNLVDVSFWALVGWTLFFLLLYLVVIASFNLAVTIGLRKDIMQFLAVDLART